MKQWKILLDGENIWNPYDDSRQIEDPVLRTEVNRAGSFSFTIRPDNPYYDAFEKLRSTVQVLWGTTLYFTGRVISETYGFYNEKEIVCESELAYLNDIVVRPFEFPESGGSATPEAYLRFLIGEYNKEAPEGHKFSVGVCNVTDPNSYIARSDTEYSSVWKLIQEGLLDTVGGYVQVRHATVNGQDVRYIDYLTEFTTTGQKIEFGQNLLDILTEKRGDEVCTAILPLGAKPENGERRIDISNEADDPSNTLFRSEIKKGDLVYNEEAETAFGGRIIRVQIWDDVTVAAHLVTKAKAELAKASKIVKTTKLTVADLTGAGVSSTIPFAAGMLLEKGESKPHEETHGFKSPSENTYLLIESCSYPLFRPQDATVSVGSTELSLTASERKKLAAQIKNVYSNMQINVANVYTEAVSEASSLISQSAEEIVSQVLSSQTITDLKTGLATVESDMSTVKQDASGLTTSVSSLEKTVNAYPDDLTSTVNSLKQLVGYIRQGVISVDGQDVIGIEIGQTQGSFKAYCQITAKALIFRDQYNHVLATFTNEALEVDAVKIANKFRLGKFEITVKSGGGWTMRWNP